MKQIVAKKFNKEDILHHFELLFSSVETLGLPESILDKLFKRHIWIIIQLCIVPQVRGICPKDTELIRKQLLKVNLDFDIIQADNIMLDEYRYGRNKPNLSSLINNFVSEMNTSARYAAKLPLPEMTDEEYQASIRQAKKDEKKGFLFSLNKRILLHAPLGDIEQYTVPCCVAEIADNAFLDRTRLKKIVIPDSVIKIGRNAFKGCVNLKKIKITEKTKDIGLNAFDDVPAAAKLPKSILTDKMIADGIKAKKKTEEKLLENNHLRISSPDNAIKGLEFLQRKLRLFFPNMLNIPELPVPSRNELDERLKSLYEATVRPLELAACCYSPAPLPDLLLMKFNELKHRLKLRFRCPLCGKYTVIDADPEQSEVQLLAHVSDLIDFAQYFKSLGLDTSVTGHGICKYCKKRHSGSKDGLRWEIGFNGLKYKIKMRYRLYVLINRFLSAANESDYSCFLQGFSGEFGLLLACLGYIKPDNSFYFDFDDETEENEQNDN